MYFQFFFWLLFIPPWFHLLVQLVLLYYEFGPSQEPKLHVTKRIDHSLRYLLKKVIRIVTYYISDVESIKIWNLLFFYLIWLLLNIKFNIKKRIVTTHWCLRWSIKRCHKVGKKNLVLWNSIMAISNNK